jgi:hypothetical protein
MDVKRPHDQTQVVMDQLQGVEFVAWRKEQRRALNSEQRGAWRREQSLLFISTFKS